MRPSGSPIHDDADEVRSAYAKYYAEFAHAAYAGLRGREQRGWKDALDLEIENVRRALAYLVRTGRLDAAAEIVWSLRPYWLTGHYIEGRKVVAEILAAPDEIEEHARARLLTVGGLLAALLTDLATAHGELEEALGWFREHEDVEGKASALVALGIATAPLDPDHARTLLVESAHLFAAIGDDWFEAIVLGSLGWLDTGRGDFTEELVFERAYLLARSIDDAIVTAHSGTNLAEMYLALGRLDDAREVLGVSLGAYEAVRLYDGLSYGLEAAAGIASSGGNAEEAARLLAAADGLRDEAGMPIWGARRTRFEALVTSARDALGDELFDSTWAEGRALGYDAALEQARRALYPTGLNASS